MPDDPRRSRTRAALAAALLRRVAEAPLESISVSQLCRDAGVHRTTFYGHAQSVGEFAIDVVTQDLDEVATVVLPVAATAVEAARIYLDTLVVLLEHVARERPLVRPLLVSRTGASLREALLGRLTERVALALEAFSARGVDVPGGGARSEAAAAVAGMIVGFVGAWATTDDTDARAAAARLQALMPPWWPAH